MAQWYARKRGPRGGEYETTIEAETLLDAQRELAPWLGQHVLVLLMTHMPASPVLVSPDGTPWVMKVANDGTLEAEPLQSSPGGTDG